MYEYHSVSLTGNIEILYDAPTVAHQKFHAHTPVKMY